MTPHIVTIDLSRFGYLELMQAGKMLNAYMKQDASILGRGVTLNFNTHSGCVFLSDEAYRVAMLDDEGKLREWYTCPECGSEGFDGDAHDLDGMEIKLRFEQCAGYCSEQCVHKAGG